MRVLSYAAMSTTSAANEPLPLPSAAQVAGIPARTLRNWIASGKLAAIRGQRGWLVRPGDIAQIAAMLGTDAANTSTAGVVAADLAASLAAPLHDPDEDAATPATAANAAAMRVLDQRADAEALVQHLLAPFIAEQTRLAEELGQVKAERAELRRRAEVAEAERDALRAQASPPPLSVAPTPSAATDTPEAPAPAGGFWQRLRRALGGE